MAPFTADIFKGILAFFLLEMGLLVARQLRDSREGLNRFTVAFAIVMPAINATVAMGFARLFGLSLGDAMLLVVLSATASYIVVPVSCATPYRKRARGSTSPCRWRSPSLSTSC